MIRNEEKNIGRHLDEITAVVSLFGEVLPNPLTLFHQQSIAAKIERELAIEQELAIARALIDVLYQTFYKEDEKEELYEDIMCFIWKWKEYYGNNEVMLCNIHDRDSLMAEILFLFSDGIVLELCLNLLERELHM